MFGLCMESPAQSVVLFVAHSFFVGPRRRWSARIGALGLALSIGGIGYTRTDVRSCRAMLIASVGEGIGVLQLWGKNTTVLDTRVCRVVGM